MKNEEKRTVKYILLHHRQLLVNYTAAHKDEKRKRKHQRRVINYYVGNGNCEESGNETPVTQNVYSSEKESFPKIIN